MTGCSNSLSDTTKRDCCEPFRLPRRRHTGSGDRFRVESRSSAHLSLLRGPCPDSAPSDRPILHRDGYRTENLRKGPLRRRARNRTNTKAGESSVTKTPRPSRIRRSRFQGLVHIDQRILQDGHPADIVRTFGSKTEIQCPVFEFQPSFMRHSRPSPLLNSVQYYTFFPRFYQEIFRCL